MRTLILTPGDVDLSQLEQVWRNGGTVEIDRSAAQAIDAAAMRVAEAAASEEAIYGVNTGFGKLASVKIAPGDTAKPAAQSDPEPLLRRR